MKIHRQSRIKENLILRSRVIQAIRQFFSGKDYLEVTTPVRIPAPTPEAQIDAQPSGRWFLQTSPELCMKHLLAAGYSKIFQICPCFRQKERGRRHLPEFIMLEWYAAGMDYGRMMTVCEELVGFVAGMAAGGRTLCYQGHKIALDGPWPRITVTQAFDRWASVSLEKALSEDRFETVLTEEIEPFLGIEKPVFVYDYPARMAALSRLKPDDPGVCERFELYIAGIEICNAFSELTDAEEQRRRFIAEADARRKMAKAVNPVPEKFLDMLADMPEAAGNALGIDRLVMLFADADTIDDVTAFVPEEL